ncbi:hypothetical protein GCM10009795_026280 [Nocardioides hankookensis]|uniref:Uncharacterized protein n=1 Tax=Nocardioides hankookensis TaxID=443157 RepID=A0ABW1LDU3_9ACTN
MTIRSVLNANAGGAITITAITGEYLALAAVTAAVLGHALIEFVIQRAWSREHRHLIDSPEDLRGVMDARTVR